MISTGDNKSFAIAAEITGTPNGWLLGKFRFVLHGHVCGNWNDDADLRGCYGWLKDFAEKPRLRFEPGLMDLSPDNVFSNLVLPVIEQSGQERIPELYSDTFSRFHISHLGMSSFDRVTMVLIESPERQRCVWKEGNDIHDDVFPPGHMQTVASEFCVLLEREAASLGVLLQ